MEHITLQILNEIILRIRTSVCTVGYRIGTARLVVVVEKVRPRAPLLGDKTVSVVVVILRHTAGGLRLAKPAEGVGEIYGRAADNGAAKFGTGSVPSEVVRPPVLIYGKSAFFLIGKDRLDEWASFYDSERRDSNKNANAEYPCDVFSELKLVHIVDNGFVAVGIRDSELGV